MSPPPNVLFITADQWRGECLSALGHPTVKTPHLDALAADGVLFERHYANCAPCGPSRASLHTGLYLQNHRSGTNGTPLDARHTNWALEAGRFGYDPVLFGYTDTSRDPRDEAEDSPWLRTYEGPLPGVRPVCHMDGRPREWVDWLRAKGFETPANPSDAYGWRDPGPDWEDGAPAPKPLRLPPEVDDVAFLTGRLKDYLSAAPGPFVAHLSLLRPHPPFVAPAPYNAMYDPASVPGFSRAASAADEARQHPFLAWHLARRGFRAPVNEARLRRLKAVYYGLMSRVDAEIGGLVAFLKETGLYERTLIVFTSDHGEQLGDHWLMNKGGYFDASFHIPLIVRDPRPGAARGRRVRAFTENVDILPTMLAAIGAAIPQALDGFSLAPFLAGEPAPATWRREAHWEYDFRDVLDDGAERDLGLTLDQCCLNVVRGERYKYVHFTKLPALFFDLKADPGETRNLAGDPAHAPLVLDYAQKLLSWRMNHDERGLGHLTLTESGVVERPSPRY
ncbi:MAG TPA: alkaline phosphatase family protein [Caulobacteraceae bacterium]|nr:alkaline phosphatase family protein [Caulobacteraceae bacterium]